LKAIVVNCVDNVATALVDIEPGETVQVQVGEQWMQIPIRHRIPFGHKFAICKIQPREKVKKYGKSIGQSRATIECGEWVHHHNVE
jgi:altronate dehydratase small subunit